MHMHHHKAFTGHGTPQSCSTNMQDLPDDDFALLDSAPEHGLNHICLLRVVQLCKRGPESGPAWALCTQWHRTSAQCMQQARSNVGQA